MGERLSLRIALLSRSLLTPLQPPSITIGYHRLHSHKAFRASLGLRIVLAALGTAAHQGSIRVGLSFSFSRQMLSCYCTVVVGVFSD